MNIVTATSNSISRLKIANLLNVLVVLFLIYINIQTASLYENTHGKDRALFAWIELIRFGYKYWLLAPVFLALILALIDWRKGGGKKAIFTSLFSILTCGLIFVRLWWFWVAN
jgi:hypothetical protein